MISVDERKKIAQHLENLYKLKGLYFKNQTEEQVKVQVRDLVEKFSNCNEIIGGIKRLESEDWLLSKIDNSTLVSSVKNYISIHTKTIPIYKNSDEEEREIEEQFKKTNQLKKKYGDKWFFHFND
jgi:hypothetical protein